MSSGCQTGWVIGRSLISELAALVTIVARHDETAAGSAPELGEIRAALPDDLTQSLTVLLPASGIPDFLEIAADWAGVLIGDDYEKASLAVRTLSPAEALRRRVRQVEKLGLSPDAGLEAGQQLVNLEIQARKTVIANMGLEVTPGGRHAAEGDAARLALRIIDGGDLRHQFWLALDRLYYEYYKPFRASKEEWLLHSEQRTAQALGKAAGSGDPDTTWLPDLNPLRLHPGFLQGAKQLGLRVVFWIEPFGLFDAWNITPDTLLVTVAEPGAVFASFRAHAWRLAQQLSALSDPTRLAILRLIRGFGMYNTEIATYLNLSRPTVSIHASILREAGLISSRAEGRKQLHTAEIAEISRLLKELASFLEL